MRRQQFIFTYGKLSYGGTLRKSRHGRGARPLSPRDPIHLVLKADRRAIPKGLRHPKMFALIHRLNRHFARKFRVKTEQIAIERDHIHIFIRATFRSQLQAFFRVLPGQIAQQMTDTPNRKQTGPKLWKYRPFTRVVKGERDYQTVRNYIRLNEMEASGKRPYSKQRLKGMTAEDIQLLWSG